MRATKQVVHIGLWTEFCLTGTKAGRVKYEKCLMPDHKDLAAQQWSRKAPGVLYVYSSCCVMTLGLRVCCWAGGGGSDAVVGGWACSGRHLLGEGGWVTGEGGARLVVVCVCVCE